MHLDQNDTYTAIETDAAVVAIFGTYSAQRAAGDSLGPHTPAYACRINDPDRHLFRQVRGPNLGFRRVRVGRVGLEPTTGGL